MLTRVSKRKKSFLTRIISRLKVVFLSDKKFLEDKFQRRLGRQLDIDTAETFSEKIQWLKLNFKRPIMTVMADKFGVRDLIRMTIGEKYLIPLHSVYESADEINIDDLPDQFILKAAHGSGWNEICFDKKSFDLDQSKKRFNKYLKHNYFRDSKEWVYKNIKPRIVCEYLILDESGFPPKDMKIFCFNGEPMYIQVDSNKYRSQMRNFYDLDWNLQPFTINYKNNPSLEPKPDNLDEMIGIARRFAEGFPFLRVDLYNLKGKIYFSEFTFYTDSGFVDVSPFEWELKFGKMVNLA